MFNGVFCFVCVVCCPDRTDDAATLLAVAKEAFSENGSDDDAAAVLESPLCHFTGLEKLYLPTVVCFTVYNTPPLWW